MLVDRLSFPFEIEILGAPAIVGGVDLVCHFLVLS
jgi:hypothetical protein